MLTVHIVGACMILWDCSSRWELSTDAVDPVADVVNCCKDCCCCDVAEAEVVLWLDGDLIEQEVDVDDVHDDGVEPANVDIWGHSGRKNHDATDAH